ncbi:MAG: hypothetical protein Q4G05_05605 [Clostridia bacterium]|nr:hypothetical protein [Clostridia bacterium]
MHYFIFKSIFTSTIVMIPFALTPFNVVEKSPELWKIIKVSYIFLCVSSSILMYNFFYRNYFYAFLSKKEKYKVQESPLPQGLYLYLGKNGKQEKIYLTEKALYQNILITGTIGTGKTSSAMYPFTEQLVSYKHFCSDKLGMLILDVKGNYYKQLKVYAKKYNRESDLLIIELNGKIKYNPLHKPNLNASVLANRLKTILTLFSQNNGESYWLDKAENILTECIKLCRLYNNGYVTFEEIHKLVTSQTYYVEKIEYLRTLFLKNRFTNKEVYNLLSAINFFEKEYCKLDDRTLAILKSEITLITNCFISDYEVHSTFCPKIEELNFLGFQEALSKGKIVVLNMNIADYKNLSKIIAAYLKLDFQTEVMSNLANSKTKTSVFISDEYSEYVTATDSSFFSQSREAKCINIIATQSYTSLLNTLNNESSVKVIVQNLVNKLWYRTDDIFTIEDAQKQIGKEDKEKISHTISENAKQTSFNYLTNTFNSRDSNLSESINTYNQYDYMYDTNFFTQHLETFSCLSFLTDGLRVLPPQKIIMSPYFKKSL